MPYKYLSSWPVVERYPQAIERLSGGIYGLDFEWNIRTETPTIMGLSDGKVTVSVPHDLGLPYLADLCAREPNATWVGHNAISTEYVIMKRLGLPVRLEQMSCTMVKMWLANMHLAKSTKKTAEGGEKRGRGFYNLWTTCSVYTSLPNWKRHRGDVCGVCAACDPFVYNGLDALAGRLANTGLEHALRLRGLDALYPLHRDLAWKLHTMSERGVLVDTQYVDTHLRQSFEEGKRVLYDKEAKGGALPFNPDSPKQVRNWFKEQGISLYNTEEATIRELTEKYPENDALAGLLDWKELGDGPDRWFKPRVWDGEDWDGYVDEAGYIHARLGFYTSSGRLNCVDPNLQNVPKRRVDRQTGESMGKKFRRAIIAPEGYWLVRADYGNAENRVVLHQAGYDIPADRDLHTWVAQIAKLDPDSEFCKKLGGPREAAKSIQHAGNILEGLDLKTDGELRKPRTQMDIQTGALLVFPDWRFCGLVVCFNGINLAERAFGHATHGARRAALGIQHSYFAEFPLLRDLQRRYLARVERDGEVRTPVGYSTLSYGPPKDRAKQAAAIVQSQPVAHATKLALLNEHPRLDDRLQVHDELVMYVDRRHAPHDIKKWVTEKMTVELKGMVGLVLPVEVSYGPNWADQTKIN